MRKEKKPLTMSRALTRILIHQGVKIGIFYVFSKAIQRSVELRSNIDRLREDLVHDQQKFGPETMRAQEAAVSEATRITRKAAEA